MAKTFDSGCNAGPQIVWRDDGYIEIVGQGVPKIALPTNGVQGPFPTFSGTARGNQGLEQWKDLVWKHALRTQVPAAFLAAIIAAESKGQANAINFGDNPHGVGLMQITSSGVRAGHSDTELLDPDLNIQLGSDYLLQLSQRYDGNPLRVAAAYNAGGAYCGAMGGCAPNRWNLKTWCGGSLKTTPDYPGNIIGFYNAAMDAGFSPNNVPGSGDDSPPGSGGNASPIAQASVGGSSIGGLVAATALALVAYFAFTRT